jgi:hypothetical protein
LYSPLSTKLSAIRISAFSRRYISLHLWQVMHHGIFPCLCGWHYSYKLITPSYITIVHDLNVHFTIRNLGDLHLFWGIEVNKIQGGLVLTKEKYVWDLLVKFGMEECKSCPTPLSTSAFSLPFLLHLLYFTCCIFTLFTTLY